MTAAKPDLRPVPEMTVGQRVRHLQRQARALAKDHIGELQTRIMATMTTAAEVADGGEVYPAGIREAAGRLIDELDVRLNTIAALLGRMP